MRWRGREEGGVARPGGRRGRALLAPLLLLAAVAALQLLSALYPAATGRYYSRGLYPQVVRVLSLPGRLTSFSLAEAALVLLTTVAAAWLAWTARRLYLRRGEAGRLLFSLLVKALWTAGVVAALFMLAFGLNYQRPPLSESLGLVRREPSPVEIETIARAVVDGINRNYAESGAGDGGERGSLMPMARAELHRVLESSFEREPLPQPAGPFAPPKPVYFSGVVSRFGISGVYSPFTGEPNYNAAQPDAALPFVVAHEMAHARGFAREAEANFVAFLVCTQSPHPYVRYSGYLNALRVLGVLARVAPARYRDVVAALGDGPRADLRAQSRYWARYEGRLSSFGGRLNDFYLKANRVRTGVRNYNEAVWLIIGYYLKEAAGGGPPGGVEN